jgi:hypothetical protein
MALRRYHSMAHDDDDLYDLAKGMPRDYEPPAYPVGLSFCLTDEDMEKAGFTGYEPGDECRFSAMGCVTSIFKSTDGCRIELELEQFAGEDGQFFDLAEPSHICLCDPQMNRMALDDDAERGDTIHLFGEAEVVSCSSTEIAGDRCQLQITGLNFESESEEAREGG